ncbi:hypothetical protein [Streptomyces sp. RKAG337]|uniref:hypothetical protein n=1 Tax=Streptomyces sp. RKAG337 TaxID=2893404 RepID=UPI00203487D2|nr:hypothetical protein [Streptomyces sp. RKAG337]MCM2430956.1 hypothetical protein [Streptomyces sp. RKAG337]
MRSTRALKAAAVVALAILAAGCAQSDPTTPTAGPKSDHPAASATPSGLPAGITALGSTSPVAQQGWNLTLQPFQQAAAGTSAGDVPAGWTVLRTQARFTNTSGQIARLPDTVLTVRYGALGRSAVAVKDSTLTGLPTREEAVKAAPQGTVTAEIGVAVPPQAAGQLVTVTAEATQDGMAQADDLFFEGKLPGSATTDDSSGAPGGTNASTGAVQDLGTWSQNRVRISPITAGPAKDGRRSASAELTVANNQAQPRAGLGITLRVMTGTSLTEAAALTPGLDYSDAPVAPSRSATATLRFSLPATAVPGPVTVEATDRDGSRITFSGTVD